MGKSALLSPRIDVATGLVHEYYNYSLEYPCQGQILLL